MEKSYTTSGNASLYFDGEDSVAFAQELYNWAMSKNSDKLTITSIHLGSFNNLDKKEDKKK